MVDESVRRREYKMGRVIQVFTGDDGVVRSARVKMAHGEFNRPVVKKTGPAMLPPLKNRNMCHQTNQNVIKTQKLKILPKLIKGQNWTNLQVGTENLSTAPILGRENLSNPRFKHTVRATPKLSLDPTNIFASYLQVWLLALIWCRKCIFGYFFI